MPIVTETLPPAFPLVSPAPTGVHPLAWERLRARQEEFARGLAIRLSLWLPKEFSVQLSGLELVPFGQVTSVWSEPSHLALFRLEPLRGVSVLGLPRPFATSLVDLIMGGPGRPAETGVELGEIAEALLAQFVDEVLAEWCGVWTVSPALQPIQLGRESNARLLQNPLGDSNFLVVTLDLRAGSCAGLLQLAFPFSSLESLLGSPGDDTPVPLIAEWRGLELSGLDLLNLKVGDVLQLDGGSTHGTQVRLGDQPRYGARLGTLAGHWAVELTESFNP